VADPLTWRELRTRRLMECRIFSVEESTAESPTDGSAHDFYRIACGDWVQLIPLTPELEVVMVRQYRHGSGACTLEIPGGLVDPGERAEQSALRECLEETGYLAEQANPLAILNPNPALFPNRLHTFWAENVRRVADIKHGPTERTEVVLVPLAELPARLRAGEIDHALVAGVLWRFLADRHHL
jgi:ADP-ribose pyrophosphatase